MLEADKEDFCEAMRLSRNFKRDILPSPHSLICHLPPFLVQALLRRVA